MNKITLGNSGWVGTLALALMALNTGCEAPGTQTASAGNDDKNDSLENCMLGKGECFTDRFEQPSAPRINKLDVLFVVDTSGSLHDEKADIGDHVDSLINELPSNMDIQFAVMMAHGSRSSHSGRLWKYRNTPYVLSNQSMTKAQIRAGLKASMGNTQDDRFSDGGEEGMYSFMRSLDPGPKTSIQAKGFYREDAGLVVIFVADENDICAEYPAGVTPVFDGDHAEGPANARDCKGVNPTTLIAKAKAFTKDRPLTFVAYVYNDVDHYPHVGENEYGYGYMDVIQKSGGISVNLANGNYSGNLAQIGAYVNDQTKLNHEFTLANSNVDPTTIDVSIDGARISDFTYDAVKNQVTIAQAGVFNSVIVIGYCQYAPLNTGTGTSTDTSVVTDPNTGTSTSTSTNTATSTVTATGTNTITDTGTGTDTVTDTATVTDTGTGTGTDTGLGGVGV